MAAISDITRAKIKGYLESFIDRVIEENRRRKIRNFDNPRSYLANSSNKPKLKPFHAAIIPEQFMRLSEFERSFSTTLGTTFEEAAHLIALEHHAEAQRAYDLVGNANRWALREIDRLRLI